MHALSAVVPFVVLVAVVAADDDSYVTLAKSYIDAGKCQSVVKGSCGTGANLTSYYNVFTYNNYRYLITSGVPSTPSANVGVNSRCEYWKYVQLPLSPSAGSTLRMAMGIIGWSVSGGHIYDPRDSVNGTLAVYAASVGSVKLDTCGGHNDANGYYHYHQNPSCLPSASDASSCVLVGYMRDGFPVYGYCQNSSGTQLASCYALTSGATGSTWSDYYYDSDAYSAGTCHLDKANGYTFSNGTYGYVMTSAMPYVPPGVLGTPITTSTAVCGLY